MCKSKSLLILVHYVISQIIKVGNPLYDTYTFR